MSGLGLGPEPGPDEQNPCFSFMPGADGKLKVRLQTVDGCFWIEGKLDRAAATLAVAVLQDWLASDGAGPAGLNGPVVWTDQVST